MKNDFLVYIGNGLAILSTALQNEETRSLISWILTIVTTSVTLIYTLWKWYKKAKADGKIDDEEAKEGLSIFARIIRFIKTIFSKKEKIDDGEKQETDD